MMRLNKMRLRGAALKICTMRKAKERLGNARRDERRHVLLEVEFGACAEDADRVCRSVPPCRLLQSLSKDAASRTHNGPSILTYGSLHGFE